MDPVSVTGSFLATFLAARGAKISLLERMARELAILSHVMRDAEEILAEGSGVLGPESGLILALKDTCSETKDKFYAVADILERFFNEQRRKKFLPGLWRVNILFIYRGDDLMSHYQSLRDSTTLARALASDIKVELLLARVDARFNERLVDIDSRINYQLSQLTGSMATLLSDEDDESDGQHRVVSGQSTTNPLSISTGNVCHNGNGRGGFRKMARIGRQMTDLSETGFIRSITLILDTLEGPNGSGSVPRQKEVKVLGKLDTASDANLVSHDMLIEEGLQEELFVAIPADQQVELHGLDGAKCTPEWEVTLRWYKVKDMKRRTDKFYVIKNAPFEVLFSSDSSFKQLSDRSVLLSLERFKPKKEVQAEIKAEEENRKKALERVEKEYREAEASHKIPARKNTATATSSAQKNAQAKVVHSLSWLQ